MLLQIRPTPRLIPVPLRFPLKTRNLRTLCRSRLPRDGGVLGGVLSSSLLLTKSAQAEGVGGGGGTIADAAVPVLFSVAVGALALITIGVAYLSISSWWESRSTPSNKKQKSQEYDEKMKKFMKTAIGDEDEKSKTSKTPSSSKGFGDP